jgi:hypothetical protein
VRFRSESYVICTTVKFSCIEIEGVLFSRFPLNCSTKISTCIITDLVFMLTGCTSVIFVVFLQMLL